MNPQEPKPSASVIVVRDGATALEVLLVQRSEAMAAHGGSWVFPGGKVEASDIRDHDLEHVETAKHAAIREVSEETGIPLPHETLRPFSHWTTPIVRPKRFANWFFLAPLEFEIEVRVDGSEIVDSRWMSFESALEARHRREIVLPPPTFITLHTLRKVACLADLPAFFERHAVERFNPKIFKKPDGEVALYQGDAGYDTLNPDMAGTRHRLHMLSQAWHYERT